MSQEFNPGTAYRGLPSVSDFERLTRERDEAIAAMMAATHKYEYLRDGHARLTRERDEARACFQQACWILQANGPGPWKDFIVAKVKNPLAAKEEKT